MRIFLLNKNEDFLIYQVLNLLFYIRGVPILIVRKTGGKIKASDKQTHPYIPSNKARKRKKIRKLKLSDTQNKIKHR